MFNLLERIKLKIKPLKKGDVLMGDCQDFGLSTTLEQIRHGLREINEPQSSNFWYGFDTYKLVISHNTDLPYYIMDGYVLTRSLDEDRYFVWFKRRIERRILKTKFHDMILKGKLIRSKT